MLLARYYTASMDFISMEKHVGKQKHISTGSLPNQGRCQEMYHRPAAYKWRPVQGWTADKHNHSQHHVRSGQSTSVSMDYADSLFLTPLFYKPQV